MRAQKRKTIPGGAFSRNSMSIKFGTSRSEGNEILTFAAYYMIDIM